MKYVLGLLLLMNVVMAQEKIAIFAGGCFWCMEAAFQPLKGVQEVDSGYMGGNSSVANYEEVSAGNSGHYEVVQIHYDSDIITYQQLLDVFWKNINPTDERGQFADRGKQYETVIFYTSPKQNMLAEASKVALEKSGKFKKR